MDRVAALLPGSKQRSPTKNMAMLLETLGGSGIVPEVDKYYVFVYKAKTPGITYDQHPFVIVTGVFQWGFTGHNLHLGQPRRYTWGEVLSNIYPVEDEELTSVEALPTTLIKQS